MIPIASPLASDTVEQNVVSLIKRHIGDKAMATGIKGCQKRILAGAKGLLILTADTTPMDLISHFPLLCEDRGVEYVFVRKKSSIPNRFTCVFFEIENEAIQDVLGTPEQPKGL